MRINHNIASLNTYRQLSNNGVNTQKSLEKLSSGLRINRAGDDAAGLAISEKMRGQIRGLDQASRNSQDAISMIQTAEGALSETHSILQRMKELATQAANGTNTDNDRGEIQKEINQLTSEINRVSNTTEFNTQKLLDGGRSTRTTANAALVADQLKLSGGVSAATANATANGAVTAGGVDWAGATNTGTITGLTNGQNITVTIGGQAITLAASNATDADSATNGTTGVIGMQSDASNNALATSARAALTAVIAANTNLAGLYTVGGTNNDITVTYTGANHATAGSVSTFGGTATISAGTLSTGTLETKSSQTIDFTAKPQEGSSINIDGKKIAFWDSSAGTYENAAAASTALTADFMVDINNKTLLQTLDDVAALTVSANVTLSRSDADTLTVTATAAGVAGDGVATSVSADTTAVAAYGTMTFNSLPTEGSKINMGDLSIGFYDSSLGNYADNTAAKAALGTDEVINLANLPSKSVSGLTAYLDNNMNLSAYNVDITAHTDSTITVTARTPNAAGNNIATAVDNLNRFESKFQVGANMGQSFSITFEDMSAKALGISSATGGTQEVTDSANPLDATKNHSANYVSITNVTDGVSNTNTEFGLSVATNADASKSIDIIDNAIAKVSGERSKMGAYQNRLEHTIANLGTSSENLTAAESRIRDVDMAKEMMEFTKNNILSQAAQAMLAQANQQPQGVLQLLR